MRKKPVKIAIWGFGAMGSGMARMIIRKQGFDIIGICDRNPNIVGKSIFPLLKETNPYKHDVLISDDIDKLLAEEKPELVLLATDSFTKKAFPKLMKLIEAGCDVISTAEEMAYPKANAPDLAEKLDKAAKEKHVTILGTGVNPGMMMDLLAIAMTGVMTDVFSMKISRVNSLSPFGETVMQEQGVGLTPKEFAEKQASGEISGHVGFRESAMMIADAIGLKVTKFTQSMNPIITNVDRKSPYGFAAKGNVCGVAMKAKAELANGMEIELDHPQQIEPAKGGVNTGDYIKISGLPPINLSNSPEVEGGLGTIAICVNMIPIVINATPGLKTMINLPVPRAIVGDVRNLIETK